MCQLCCCCGAVITLDTGVQNWLPTQIYTINIFSTLASYMVAGKPDNLYRETVVLAECITDPV